RTSGQYQMDTHRLATACLISSWELLEVESSLAGEPAGNEYEICRVWDLLLSCLLISVKTHDSPDQFAALIKQTLIGDYHRRIETAMRLQEQVFTAFRITDENSLNLEEKVKTLAQPLGYNNNSSRSGMLNHLTTFEAGEEDLVKWWTERIIPNTALRLSDAINDISRNLTAPELFLQGTEKIDRSFNTLAKEEHKALEVFLDREKIRFIELSFSIERMVSRLRNAEADILLADFVRALDKWLKESVFHSHLVRTMHWSGQLGGSRTSRNLLLTRARLNVCFARIIKVFRDNKDEVLPGGAADTLFTELKDLLAVYETTLVTLRENVCALPYPDEARPILYRLNIDPSAQAPGTVKVKAEIVNVGKNALTQLSLLAEDEEQKTWDYLWTAPEEELSFLEIGSVNMDIPVRCDVDRPRFLIVKPTPPGSTSGRSVFIPLPITRLRPPVIHTLEYTQATDGTGVVKVELSRSDSSPAMVAVWIDGIPLDSLGDSESDEIFRFTVSPPLSPGSRFVRAAVWNALGSMSAAGLFVSFPETGLTATTVSGFLLCILLGVGVFYYFGGFTLLSDYIRKRRLKAQLLELKGLYHEELIDLGRRLLAYSPIENLPPRLREIHNDLERVVHDRSEISQEIDVVLKEEAVVDELSGTWEKVKTMVSHLKNLKDELARLDETLTNAYLLAGRAIIEEEWAKNIDFGLTEKLSKLTGDMEQVKRSLWLHGDQRAQRLEADHETSSL
ncbi:MAG: hypothetical protein QGH40_10165, partial [bacterium]|nr:hypothetical protein [bacterium]